MWESKKIGDVCLKTETINPTLKPEETFTYIDVSSVSKETLRIEETQSLIGKDAPSRARRGVRKNDVIFATIRPTLRRVACVPKELNGQVCSTGYIVLRSNDEVDYRYLFYWLISDAFMKRMGELQTGASYPAVTDKQVREELISYPSLSEQQRIVEKLDAAFAEIDRASECNDHSSTEVVELHAKVLSALLTEGDSVTSTSISDQTDMLSGFAFKSGEYTDVKSDIALLRGDNISPLSINLTEAKRYPAEKSSEYEKFSLAEDDIVLGMDRPWISTGLRVAKLSSNDLPCLLVQRVMRLRAANGILPDFLYMQLQSVEFLKHILGNQTGLGVPHISGKTIGSFRFALPSIARQQEIMERYSELKEHSDKLKKLKEFKADNLLALKSAILTQELQPCEAA